LRRIVQPPFLGTTFLSAQGLSSSVLEITQANAGILLACSVKLNLKLEPRIFVGLAQKWYGPWQATPRDPWHLKFESDKRSCALLLESLNFREHDSL
jgi:hypothetical protein